MRDVVNEPGPNPAVELFPRPDAWRSRPEQASLSGSFRSVAVPASGSGLRRLLAFLGPGYLVAVGYMDPGNWATDLAAGSAFGYRLLSVVLISSLMAALLQTLAARLGVATGRDLAQACRDHFGPRVSGALWLLAEIAICACDLAELLGAALALQLLFGLPLLAGIALTTLDVLLILVLQQVGFRRLEAFVVALLSVVGVAFAVQLALARPSLAGIGAGLVPSPEIVTRPEMLYLAIGVIGATIMPHNLYLHSAIVQTRRFPLTPEGRRGAARLAAIDSSIALALAFFVNAAILVLAAAAFHADGLTKVADIAQAHELLTPLLGAGAATLFALALLASGQNASVTATLAGQVVMEGFVRLRLAPWKRRLVTRAIATLPAFAVIALQGEQSMGKLLILSQVVLSLQLPFAVIPLVIFTSDRAKMGDLVCAPWLKVAASFAAAAIVLMNLTLLAQIFLA